MAGCPTPDTSERVVEISCECWRLREWRNHGWLLAGEIGYLSFVPAGVGGGGGVGARVVDGMGASGCVEGREDNEIPFSR